MLETGVFPVLLSSSEPLHSAEKIFEELLSHCVFSTLSFTSTIGLSLSTGESATSSTSRNGELHGEFFGEFNHVSKKDREVLGVEGCNFLRADDADGIGVVEATFFSDDVVVGLVEVGALGVTLV